MKVYSKFLFALLMTFSFLSCESYLGGDLNSDPNKPSTVPVTAQTPAIQIVMADVTGGAFSRFNSMLVQQVEGVARQWSSFNQYTGLTPNRFDAAWENIYENILIEIKSARQKAVDNDYKHYQGVLNVMEAYSLMIATDVWDDMPYTEALEGLGNLNPKFDKQTDIYAKIYSLIDEGISLLNGPSGSVTPGNEDVLYGGDISKWIKAAHALKARGLLKDNNYTAAMSEAQQAFASAADNFAYQYPDANDAGQWYRFNRDRTGDIEFHPTMKKLLTDLNDTDRLGVMDQEFITDHTYLVPNFLQEMITYREMQFIIAEADVRAGGTQAGYDAYLAGIKASFDRLGVSDKYDAYIAQESVNPGVGNLTLETVMTQKYIAMFLQPEVYSDWRRTAIPALTPVSGTTVPVRWNYAATEFLFNSNAPAESEVNIYTDKVGWNK